MTQHLYIPIKCTGMFHPGKENCWARTFLPVGKDLFKLAMLGHFNLLQLKSQKTFHSPPGLFWDIFMISEQANVALKILIVLLWLRKMLIMLGVSNQRHPLCYPITTNINSMSYFSQGSMAIPVTFPTLNTDRGLTLLPRMEISSNGFSILLMDPSETKYRCLLNGS